MAADKNSGSVAANRATASPVPTATTRAIGSRPRAHKARLP